MRLFLASLAITQVVANPSLPEPGAEFVVVQNTGSQTVTLDGVRLTDSGRAIRGVVPPDTNLEPGQRIVLQPSFGADAYGCSPVPHRALLTAWAPLNNSGDSVVLEAPDGREVDRVTYEGPAAESSETPCSVPPSRPGQFRFAATEVTLSEGSPAATLEVLRSGGTNGRVTVPWRAIDASATRGNDYATAEGGVTFAAGQQRASLTVPLLGDSRDEPDESFTVVLGGGAAIEPTRAVVRLLDDDAPAPPVLTPTLPGGPLPGGGSGGAHGGGSGAAPGTLPPGSPPPGTPGSGSPAGGATASQGSVPVLAVAAWQPVLRRRGIVAVVHCDRACDVAVRGRVALGAGRTVRLSAVRRRLLANTPTTLRLRVPRRAVKSLRRALRRRGKLRATITAGDARRRVWIR